MYSIRFRGSNCGMIFQLNIKSKFNLISYFQVKEKFELLEFENETNYF